MQNFPLSSQVPAAPFSSGVARSLLALTVTAFPPMPPSEKGRISGLVVFIPNEIGLTTGGNGPIYIFATDKDLLNGDIVGAELLECVKQNV